MKGFLFDENLPARRQFSPSLPVAFVSVLGTSPSDTQVWEHARTNEFVIVTKDADFSARIILASPPPWVVHLRFGNLRRQAYHERMAQVWPQVEAMLNKHKLVNVYADRIEGIG